MTGRVNRRGWIVLESISSFDSLLCVDVFRHPNGGFGFEHFRADPEDQGQWRAVGGFGHQRFESLQEACDAASDAIDWLTTEVRARAAWEFWQQSTAGQNAAVEGPEG